MCSGAASARFPQSRTCYLLSSIEVDRPGETVLFVPTFPEPERSSRKAMYGMLFPWAPCKRACVASPAVQQLDIAGL